MQSNEMSSVHTSGYKEDWECVVLVADILKNIVLAH